MLSRVLSTLILWAVVLTSLWFFGAHAAVIILSLLAALTLYEFYGMMAKMGLRPFRWMGIFFGLLMTGGQYFVSYYFEEFDTLGNLATGLLVLALLVCCVRVLRERDANSRIEAIGSTLVGLLYIPFMLQFLVSLLMLDLETGDTLVLCLWVIAVAKFCDVGALLTGMAIGRHKMAPLISPKKTWEGAVGGVLISSGVGAAIAYFAADHMPATITPLVAALIAAPLAIIAIISDLIESALKRRADTKDTGALIPGIGGAFDLTDSLILTAPVAYFVFFVLA